MNGEVLALSLMICKTLDIQFSDLLSLSRERAIVDARFLCIYFIKKRLDKITLEEIGMQFGKKDNGSAHSFARYAIRKTEELSVTDSSFKAKYTLCSNLMGYDMDFNNIPQF